MPAPQPGGRELKRVVARVLADGNGLVGIEPLAHLPGRRLVNPLFALFCDVDERVRWRAVSAMGRVVARLAAENPESARVVVRRCMWNLNEESGGIGWGCAEAMGEALALAPELAREYGGILLGYLDPDGNYIDHPPLQEGVLWGAGRLLQVHPAMGAGCARHLRVFLASPSAALRGLAARASGACRSRELMPALAALANDGAVFTLYEDGVLARVTVGATARRALQER
jgi:hypothetical protein